MVAREELSGSCSESEALAIYNKVREQGNFRMFCMQFMMDEDCQVARNALWVATKAKKEETDLLIPLRDNLIDLAMNTAHSSVRRLAMNVVERLPMAETDVRTDFLDFCLEHMTDVKELPGIQSLSMKLAYRMCAFYPELMGELKRIVEAMEVEYYSPAVTCVRRKILMGKKV